jgi:hypothetical protein
MSAFDTAKLIHRTLRDVGPPVHPRGGGVPLGVGEGRALYSSTFQLNLSRVGTPLLIPQSIRLRGNHAPNVSLETCLR